MLGRRDSPDDGIAGNRRPALLGLLVLGGLLVFTGPALAQDGTPTALESGAAANPVCADSSGTLANLIESFVQITTARIRGVRRHGPLSPGIPQPDS